MIRSQILVLVGGFYAIIIVQSFVVIVETFDKKGDVRYQALRQFGLQLLSGLVM